jgi:hypothetical protein
MWDVLEDFEAFIRHFQRSGGFFLNYYDYFINITRLFKEKWRLMFRKVGLL